MGKKLPENSGKLNNNSVINITHCLQGVHRCNFNLYKIIYDLLIRNTFCSNSLLCVNSIK
jgi:hypothetical protein